VRKAKDNRRVAKLYYHPEHTHCPRCGHTLQRAYPWWRKYMVFLRGRYQVISIGYRCSNPNCLDARQGRIHLSQVAERLALCGSSFALEVIVQIGYWRFWKHWTVAHIHHVLTVDRCLPISERQVLYLIGIFLVLHRCTYHLRLKEHATYFRRHGVFIGIDALKPEKGNAALYVVRELKFGTVLHVASALTTDHKSLEWCVLQPVKALGYRMRGVVSDDEQALVLAVAHVFPGVPHQTCQVHCLRDAAQPIADADRAFKKALKRAIRAPLYAVYRRLEQLPSSDPRQAVLTTYADLVRSTLTEGSKPPFDLGGLRVFADLARLEASLQRSREKGGIRSWSSWWRLCNCAMGSRRAIVVSGANGSGSSNWSGAWIRRCVTGNRAQRVVKFRKRCEPFWTSWHSTRGATPKMHEWSPTSGRRLRNAGTACSRVMLGRSDIARTMNWKRSSTGCGRVSARSMDASPPKTLSCATASGRFSLIRMSPWRKYGSGSSSFSQFSSIKSTRDFAKPNNAFKCCIAFGTSRAVV